MSKYLDSNGLLYFWGKIKALAALKVDKVDGKALSSNDYTDTEKTKLAGIAAGANAYVHPTSDGNKHIPATGTSNNGKFLRAGSTAGSTAWGTLENADVTTALGYTPENATTAASTYATKTELGTYATQTELESYAKTSDLTAYAKTTDLSSYAKTSALDEYAKTSALSSYATVSSLGSYATKTELTNAVSGMYKYKGAVATVSALPTSGNTLGDVWDVQASGHNYAWNGTDWDDLGGSFSVEAIENSEIDTIAAS